MNMCLVYYIAKLKKGKYKKLVHIIKKKKKKNYARLDRKKQTNRHAAVTTHLHTSNE